MGRKLEVELTVLDKATNELNKVARSFNGFQEKITRFGAAITKIAVGGAIVGGAIEGMRRMTQAGIDYSSSILDMANRTGMTTEEVQRLDYVAKMTGSSFDALSPAVRGLTTYLRTTGDTSQTVSQAFFSNIDRIAKMENGTQRLIEAQKVFGRGSANVASIINDLRRNGKSLTEMYGEMGNVLSEDVIRGNEDAGDAQVRFDIATKQLSSTFSVIFAPSIMAATASLEKLLSVTKGWITYVDREELATANLTKRNNELRESRRLLSAQINRAQDSGESTISGYDDAGNEYTKSIAVAKAELAAIKAQIADNEATIRSKKTGGAAVETPEEREARIKKELDASEKAYAEFRKKEEARALAQQAFDREQYDAKTKEIDDYNKNLEDKRDARIKRELAAEKRAAEEKIRIAQVLRQAEDNMQAAAVQSTQATFALGRLAVQNSRANAQEKKRILTGMAIMEGAATIITAVKAGWDSGVTYWDKAGLAIAGGVVAGAQTIGEIATIQGASFQYGGIVPGNSYSGDRVRANLNSGEAVLNRAQQARLMAIADGQRSAGGSAATFNFYDRAGNQIETIRAQIRRGSADGFIQDLRKELRIAA